MSAGCCGARQRRTDAAGRAGSAWRAGAECASDRGCPSLATLSIELANQVVRLQERWVRDAGVRRDSAAARIIDLLPAQPIVSAATIRGAVSVSHQRSLVALKDLEAAGVVRQITECAYDRHYAADGLFELIERFEEQVIAAPTFDSGS